MAVCEITIPLCMVEMMMQIKFCWRLLILV
jgi:hypothetical protein